MRTAGPHARLTAYISLGSNLGDSEAVLAGAAAAIAALPDVELLRLSPVYRTEPQDVRAQPFFLNQAAALSCPADMPPERLLDELQAVERAFGRDRSRERPSGPRSLDLDLLLFGNKGMNSGRLTLPHPRMLRRAFVLVPLADIAPDMRLPQGLSVSEALAGIDFRLEEGVIYQNGPA